MTSNRFDEILKSIVGLLERGQIPPPHAIMITPLKPLIVIGLLAKKRDELVRTINEKLPDMIRKANPSMVCLVLPLSEIEDYEEDSILILKFTSSTVEAYRLIINDQVKIVKTDVDPIFQGVVQAIRDSYTPYL